MEVFVKDMELRKFVRKFPEMRFELTSSKKPTRLGFRYMNDLLAKKLVLGML